MLTHPQIAIAIDIAAIMVGLTSVPLLARGHGLGAAWLMIATGEVLVGYGGLLSGVPRVSGINFAIAALILLVQYVLARARRAGRKAGNMPEPSKGYLAGFRVIGAYAVPTEAALRHAKKHHCPVPPLSEQAAANIRTCAHCGELCGVTEPEMDEYIRVLTTGEPVAYVCHVCVVCLMGAGAITKD